MSANLKNVKLGDKVQLWVNEDNCVLDYDYNDTTIEGTVIALDKDGGVVLGWKKGEVADCDSTADTIDECDDYKEKIRGYDTYMRAYEYATDWAVESITPGSSGFVEQFKEEATKASWRVCSKQMVNGVQAGIVSLARDKGMDDGKAAVLKEILASDYGNALISVGLGYGLQYVPQIKDDPRVVKLAEEFRVGGMATAGNELVGSLFSTLMPALQGALKSLPPLPEVATTKTETKKRVANPKPRVLAVKKIEHRDEEEQVEMISEEKKVARR